MLTLISHRSPASSHHIQAEHAATMIGVAAELLATDPSVAGERHRFAEVARRIRHAVRSPRCDARTVLTASPAIAGPDGSIRPMTDMVLPYCNDPESGIRAAITLFLTSDWRPAA